MVLRRRFIFEISKIDLQGIKYGIMWTTIDNPDNNPANWKFHYCPKRKGKLPKFEKDKEYKFASFAMGTHPKLTYSKERKVKV